MNLEDLDVGIPGWRNRATGAMHLYGDCPDFERLEAGLIEDALWRPRDEYPSLCTWCFPLGSSWMAPATDASQS